MSTRTLITPNFVARAMLTQLRNNLAFGKLVHREYKNEFVPKGGGSVTIRKPNKYTVTDGATLSVQDTIEPSVVFTINKRKHVALEFSTQELTHSVEAYTERYIVPAAIALANQIDMDLAALYKDTFFYSGTAGTTPASFTALAGGAKVLNKHAAPMENRSLVVDPDAHIEAANVLKDVYNPEIVKGAIRGINMGTIAGQGCYMDQNIYKHTKGTANGNYLVNGASQTGNTLVVDNGTGTFLVGDLFTIAGVYSVNPRNYQNTGSLQPFVVTANEGTGGACTLSIAPNITTSGAFQTVVAGPADDAAITVIANHTANLSFTKQAFGLVTVPLELPDGAAWKKRVQHEGISIRLVKQYDITNDLDPLRCDIFYGVKTLYPELACRVLG